MLGGVSNATVGQDDIMRIAGGGSAEVLPEFPAAYLATSVPPAGKGLGLRVAALSPRLIASRERFYRQTRLQNRNPIGYPFGILIMPVKMH